jgi:hypothetical protein
MARETDSETLHKGHPKMFPPVFNEEDPRTSWQKFEDLASKVLQTPKTAIDTHKPLRPWKGKWAQALLLFPSLFLRTALLD